MHTVKSDKVLKWKNCGTYHITECGQYYAYREGAFMAGGARDVWEGHQLSRRVPNPRKR